MFVLTRSEKYACICNSCAKRFENSEELTTINTCTDGSGGPGTISAGVFCDDCLRLLRDSITKHLDKQKK